MSKRRIPILIVGGGPVGLTAALELHRRGLPVRVFERDTVRESFSKALAINPRTLKLLEACGMTERLLGEGIKIHRLRIEVEGRRAVTLDLDQLDESYPFMLGLPQSRTESLLEACLSEHGIAVERGVEVQDIELAGKEARLTARRGAESLHLTSSCVLAADGAHSTLRKALGIAFPGSRAPQTFQMIDGEIAWDGAHDQVAIFLLQHRVLATIPLPVANCYRFIAVEEDPLRRLPPGAKLVREDWRSSFQVSYRLAERFSQGAVHLAGDAAHIHSPIGARGMNLGIEDACVFAQKVAAGGLASYGTERRAVASGVIALTRSFTGLIVAQGGLRRIVRDHVAWRLLGIPPVRRRALRGIAGLDHPNPVTS